MGGWPQTPHPLRPQAWTEAGGGAEKHMREGPPPKAPVHAINPKTPPHTHTRHHLHNKEALLSRTLQHPVTQLYVPWSLPSPDLRGYPNSEPPPYGQEEEMPLSSIKQNKTKSCQSCQGEEETLVKTGHGYCHSCLCAVAQNWPEEPPANPGAWLRPGWNIHPGLTGR